VLAGVLLHVIEAPGPVDHSGDSLPGLQGSSHHVPDLAIVTVDDIEDAVAAQGAGVKRLAPRCGVKRGPV
jgi:hypothetical protein